MKCVVCGQSIATGQERYPNDWERVRKRFPCCGEACATRYNPDVHWIPAVWPPAVGDGEEQRLLAVVGDRVRNGDNPSVVLREMLQAGVSPAGLRRVVSDHRLSAAHRKDLLSGLDLIGRWFGRRVRAREDRRDVSLLDEAFAILDEWEHARAISTTS